LHARQEGGHEVSSDELRSLVTRAQTGDRAALETLLGEIRPHVFRYVLARLADRATAEDVTQEVAMTVVSALPRYVDTGRPVLAWVFGIAMRKVSEVRRALGRRPESSVDTVPDRARHGTPDDPETVTVRLETTRQMAALLATLPHPQGEILRLRIAAGLSADETATVLGMTPGAVRVAQHRALAKLRAAAAGEVLR
jgi:RNA polymerase sigma-70 factor (ECF subfamily)